MYGRDQTNSGLILRNSTEGVKRSETLNPESTQQL